ncbi:MAG: DNA mismatch repair endonuclease MutL, partial [Burkholderiales bacterium]|nr:DNA mismatch repair endonuclease MutL [Anaerolineae bacterium]
MAIQVLAENVVAQIAAGEVVERPASVVKELLENALDAGAENIHVAVNGGGQRMIRISDDGMGIPATEVELAFTRHATSKLETVDDLMSLITLGFRGEALSSVASVSRLTVTTRHRDEKMGTKLRLEGGQLLQRQAVGAPVGTVITVENLFYNTPARLKFLKGENTEKRQIASIVTRYAMAYPQVRFVLEQDGREAFRSNGSGQLADVLVAALGLDSFRNMVEVQSEDDVRAEIPVRVFGYTSMPGLNRADRSHITLFVNGRWIHDSTLTFAITQAYHTFLMTGRHPVTVLMIELPTDEVDVNVHPTKAEVRFRDSGIVFEAVQRAVRRAVVELAQTPTVRGGRYAGLSTSPLTHEEEMAQRENEFDPLGAGRDLQLDMDLPLQSPGQHARRWNAEERE